jgi:hypothetical protein
VVELVETTPLAVVERTSLVVELVETTTVMS